MPIFYFFFCFVFYLSGIFVCCLVAGIFIDLLSRAALKVLQLFGNFGFGIFCNCVSADCTQSAAQAEFPSSFFLALLTSIKYIFHDYK